MFFLFITAIVTIDVLTIGHNNSVNSFWSCDSLSNQKPYQHWYDRYQIPSLIVISRVLAGNSGAKVSSTIQNGPRSKHLDDKYAPKSSPVVLLGHAPVVPQCSILVNKNMSSDEEKVEGRPQILHAKLEVESEEKLEKHKKRSEQQSEKTKQQDKATLVSISDDEPCPEIILEGGHHLDAGGIEEKNVDNLESSQESPPACGDAHTVSEKTETAPIVTAAKTTMDRFLWCCCARAKTSTEVDVSSHESAPVLNFKEDETSSDDELLKEPYPYSFTDENGIEVEVTPEFRHAVEHCKRLKKMFESDDICWVFVNVIYEDADKPIEGEEKLDAIENVAEPIEPTISNLPSTTKKERSLHDKVNDIIERPCIIICNFLCNNRFCIYLCQTKGCHFCLENGLDFCVTKHGLCFMAASVCALAMFIVLMTR